MYIFHGIQNSYFFRKFNHRLVLSKIKQNYLFDTRQEIMTHFTMYVLRGKNEK